MQCEMVTACHANMSMSRDTEVVKRLLKLFLLKGANFQVVNSNLVIELINVDIQYQHHLTVTFLFSRLAVYFGFVHCQQISQKFDE